MMDAQSLVTSIPGLRRRDLEIWIRDELVTPDRDGQVAVFTEMECARVRLICTLHYDLEIPADTLPMIVSLIDQLYDARQRFSSLAIAVGQQEQAVREAILAATLAPTP